MTPLEAFLLALIQGITEFLPISSSAHLILLPYVLGWKQHSLGFDVVTNAGTLLAAMVYFRHDLRRAGRQALASLGGGGTVPRSAYLGLGPAILLASVPVVAVAIAFYGWFQTSARQPTLIAAMSIVFGLLLWVADRRAAGERRLSQLRWRDSVAIGLAQAIALIPGTSRSGVTITAGLLLGYSREEAARFSLMLAIPVGILAFLRSLLDLLLGAPSAEGWLPLVIGFGVSAVSAYLVIGWLLRWLRHQSLSLFVVYRVLLGVAILVWCWNR